MIYTYKHLPGRISGFHENIAHFFEQLFEHAPAVYDEKLLLKPGFIPVVNKSKQTLKANLEKITVAYYNLPPAEKDIVKTAFSVNNNIKNLCTDTLLLPVKFKELEENISILLKSFFMMLWENYPQNQLVEEQFGTVQEHFNAFVHHTHQKALICPFCGIHKLKPSEGKGRDAYDHYLAKAFYPFISINFLNLFPTCHECNSDVKKVADPLYDEKLNRRNALHPFDDTYPQELLSLNINLLEPYNTETLSTLLKQISWEYSILLDGAADERLTTWDAVYDVKSRYKANMLGGMETEWFEELKRRYKREFNKGTTFNDFKNEVLEDAKYQIMIAGMGILKYSYFCFIFTLNEIESKMKSISENEIIV